MWLMPRQEEYTPVNQELLSLIEQICREKGVEKPVLVEAILSAVVLRSAQTLWRGREHACSF